MTQPVDDAIPHQRSISTDTARLLAHTTKSAPQNSSQTPRWLLRFLPWVPVDAGTFRVNRRKKIVPVGHRVVAAVDDGTAVVMPHALRAVPLFQTLSDDLLAAIVGRLRQEDHPAGEVVEEPGGAPRLTIVVDGKLETTTQDPHGLTVRQSLLGSGNYWGQESLVRGDAAPTVSVRALTSTSLLVLTREDWNILADRDPAFEVAIATAGQRAELANEFGEREIRVQSGHEGEVQVPATYADYEDDPREIGLNLVQTVLQVHTRVTDVYNSPYDQLEQQRRLTVEAMRERQEWDLINDPSTGLISQADPDMRTATRRGVPTPDDMDELLSMVWKAPAFFLAHPAAIAAFGRECTRRGVPPPTAQICGSPFLTWRGVPIVPSDKLGVTRTGDSGGRTKILLMRVGEERAGVIGLHQPGIPDELPDSPSLSMRFMGIDATAMASYLLTLYSSAAVLTDDALAVLEGVEVGRYHDYD